MLKKYGLGLAAMTVIVLFAVMSSSCGQSTSTTSYATGAVSGVVTNSAGSAVAGTIVNTFNGSSVLTATTDSTGTYTISGVWNGVHVLMISSSSEYAAQSVAVTENTTTTHNITTEAGTTATVAPTITMSSESMSTSSGFFTVAGTVTPVGQVSNVVVSVNNNDSLAAVSSGGFSKVVNLISGTNTIVVTAFNSLGYDHKTITVTYTPPAVQTGSVKITLNWDKADDIDLHLWNSTGDKHTYWSRYYGGPLDSVTVEVVDASGTVTSLTRTKDTTAKALPNTVLDYDNRTGTGPENITIFSNGLTQEGRYLVGVNGYNSIYNPYPITCSVSVKLPDGTTKAYTHVITSSNSGAGNPNTDTANWWRPFDIVVSSSGVVSIGTADTSATPTTTGARVLDVEKGTK